MSGNYSIRFSVPLFVYVKKKKFSLNLNEYRNTHHQILAKAKKNFEHEIFYATKIARTGGSVSGPVELSLVLFDDGTRKRDLSNICSIVDKFVCDALVKAKILPDDSCKQIPKVSYTYGGVDKDNPRVNVTLQEL